MNKLRKFLNVSVMVMTILVMSGFAAFTPNVAMAAASAGDLIKMEGNSSVYYFDGEKRFVFPNETTYMSWYSDFSGVVTIEASELQSYPLGGNVTMRPGTKLVKITTDPSVYAVEPNGVLRKIQNEAQAAALYGTDWAKRVVDVPDAFFVNYTIGQALASGEIPAGTLVKTADSAAVYYFDGSEYREISSESAMNANRFSFSNVITIEAIAAGGDAITGMEEALVDTAQGATTGSGTVVTGSGLMVSLNSATPAAMNVPASSSVEFLKINLTAANDGPVNVNSMTLTAFGLSNATLIDDVTVYDNGVKVGTDKDINSDRKATFNFSNPIYVAAGSTKTLTIKATVFETYGSYGLGIASASDIISTGATVSGSFPIQGNLMSPVESTVGNISVTNQNTADGYIATFGEDDVLLADFELRVSEEDALFQSLRLYNEGTRSDSILSNPVLYIDGVKVAEGTYADRYVSFDFNYEVEKGDFALAEVRADINIADAGDIISLDFKADSDIVAVGMTHGFTLTTDAEGSLDGTDVELTTGDFTIDMDKSATPAKEVKPDTSNVVLATMSFESNGENATILSIDGNYFTIVGNDELENIKMVDKSNGVAYDLDAEYVSTAYELSLEEEIYLTKGVTKTFEVRADIKADAAENDTFVVVLDADALEVEGEDSGAVITDITPGDVSSAITTVKSASMTVSDVSLTNLTVVASAEDQLVYRANVKAGSADDIRIQSFTVATSTGTGIFNNNNISALSIYLDGKLMTTVSNRINGGEVTFSSLSNNIVKAGKTSVLTIEADFSSSLDDGSFTLTADSMIARSVTGNEALSGTGLTITSTGSRLVTIAERGTLEVSILTNDSSANNDSLVLAGSESDSDNYLGEIKFTTANEDIIVEDLTLATSTGTTADSVSIESVKLYDEDGVLIAEQVVEADGSAIFEDVNLTFEADKSTSLFIAVSVRGINNGDAMATAIAGTKISYELGDVVAKGVSSSEDIDTTGLAGGKTNLATIVGSKLTSIANALADGKLTNGNNRTIAKYKFVFDNGDNQDADNDEVKAFFDAFVLDITSSSELTINNFSLYVEGKSETKATSTDAASWTGLGEVDMDGEVTIVVTANITGAVENSWLQTQLDLSSSEVVKYYDNAKTSPEIYEVSGVVSSSAIDGAYLEN